MWPPTLKPGGALEYGQSSVDSQNRAADYRETTFLHAGNSPMPNPTRSLKFGKNSRTHSRLRWPRVVVFLPLPRYRDTKGEDILAQKQFWQVFRTGSASKDMTQHQGKRTNYMPFSS